MKKIKLFCFFVLLFNAFAINGFAFESPDIYPSWHEVPGDVNWCSNTCEDGTCQTSHVSCAGFNYYDMELRTGFELKHDMFDSKVRCGRGLDYECPEQFQMDMLDWVRGKSDFPPSGFTSDIANRMYMGTNEYEIKHYDRFRIYVPPGTIKAALTIFTPRNSMVTAVVRRGAPPSGDYSSSNYSSLSERWYSYEHLSYNDGIYGNGGGTIIPFNSDMKHALKPKLFIITDSVLAQLQNKGVPNDLINSLRNLKGTEYKGLYVFLNALDNQIGVDKTEAYRSLFLEEAYQFKENDADWVYVKIVKKDPYQYIYSVKVQYQIYLPEYLNWYETVDWGDFSTVQGTITGSTNTGDTNTGDTNTGDTNTGDTNTGDRTGNISGGNTNTGGTTSSNISDIFASIVAALGGNSNNSGDGTNTVTEPEFTKYIPLEQGKWTETEIPKSEMGNRQTVVFQPVFGLSGLQNGTYDYYALYVAGSEIYLAKRNATGSISFVQIQKGDPVYPYESKHISISSSYSISGGGSSTDSGSLNWTCHVYDELMADLKLSPTALANNSPPIYFITCMAPQGNFTTKSLRGALISFSP